MAKIAISLPDEVLDAVEKERSESGISRSEYFRRTVEEHLRRTMDEQIRREKEKEDTERYIQGYLEDPESPEELAWAQGTMHYAFDDESREEDFMT